MLKTIIVFILSFFALCASAKEEVKPLPAEDAFILHVMLQKNNQLILQWNIAPGYFLYRNKIKISPLENSISIVPVQFKEGFPHHDKLRGSYEIYKGQFQIPVVLRETKGMLRLNIDYQGCSDFGFCYAPIKKILEIDLSKMDVPQNVDSYVQIVGEAIHSTYNQNQNENIDEIFNGKGIIFIMLSFLGLGLLLAFTPCVLPMIPILSGIIVGSNKKAKKKSFFLSLSYVLGMAITYAIAGIVIALIGSSIQAELEKPWIIVLFSGLFILLALSLFGLYELRLPQRFQHFMTLLSNKQKGGTYIGVFLMGCLSTLIVSPCVSAPLVGVLAYIGHTGNVFLGGFALLALGLGMGIPLLLIGISADRILPKAGYWMTLVEKVFGFMMLGLAIWMLSRMIPGPITLFLWSLLFVAAAIFLRIYSPIPIKLRFASKGLAVIFLVYGIILMLGSVTGNSDPFEPWAQFGNFTNNFRSENIFKEIDSQKTFETALQAAAQNKKIVLLDFYADWCTSCVMMNRDLFPRPEIKNALNNIMLLRINLTNKTQFGDEMLKQFKIVGPPTIIFFSPQGQELTLFRIVGEVSPEDFLSRLKSVQESA